MENTEITSLKITSVTTALAAVTHIFKTFYYFKDASSYLIVGLFVLLTYCFRFFDTVPYLLFVGPKGTGKTLIFDILEVLCYRGLTTEDATKASVYHFTNQVRGTLLLDESEDLARRNPRKSDLSTLRAGYKKKSKALRVLRGKLARLNSFGVKAIGSIGGVYDRALMDRCVQIRTVKAEQELERFSITLYGKELKHLASQIGALFKKKSLQKKIETLHRNFPRGTGLVGRDLELWIGMLVISQLIDEERKSTKKVFNNMLKIAIAITEKRREDESTQDLDIEFLLSLANYVAAINYDGTYLLPADEITQYVNDDVKPRYKPSPESFSRKWNRLSLFIKRGWTPTSRDKNGKLGHKRAWQIDVKRLDLLVAPYQRFLPTQEQLEKAEKEQIAREREQTAREIEQSDFVKLSEEGKRRAIGEAIKPKGW